MDKRRRRGCDGGGDFDQRDKVWVSFNEGFSNAVLRGYGKYFFFFFLVFGFRACSFLTRLVVFSYRYFFVYNRA